MLPIPISDTFFKIGNKIKLKSLACTAKQNAVYGKCENEHKQSNHHNLAHLFYSLLNTSAAHQKAEYGNNSHPYNHFNRV